MSEKAWEIYHRFISSPERAVPVRALAEIHRRLRSCQMDGKIEDRAHARTNNYSGFGAVNNFIRLQRGIRMFGNRFEEAIYSKAKWRRIKIPLTNSGLGREQQSQIW